MVVIPLVLPMRVKGQWVANKLFAKDEMTLTTKQKKIKVRYEMETRLNVT